MLDMLFPSSAPTCIFMQEVSQVQAELAVATHELQAATSTRPLSDQQQLNLQLTQMQKQLASSAAVDGSLRAIGTAYAALLALIHRDGLNVAKRFLTDAPAAPAAVCAGAAAVGENGAVSMVSKVLKLGDCSMKRLRNGDFYKVGCHHVGPHGCLVPCMK